MFEEENCYYRQYNVGMEAGIARNLLEYRLDFPQERDRLVQPSDAISLCFDGWEVKL